MRVFGPMSVRPFFASIAATALVACGGAAPRANTPPTAPSASASATAAIPEPPPGVSVVRFDDLGVSFAVPPGFHVVGDDDLAARVRASANPRLTAALQSRAPQKKGLPLLTLSKEPKPGDTLTLTLTATIVPTDATVTELLAQQQSVMKENLESFTALDMPREHVQDNVRGLELSDRYALRSGNDVRKVASTMRLYVRDGLAFAIVAVWSDGTDHADEARGLLDGLHFTVPDAR